MRTSSRCTKFPSRDKAQDSVSGLRRSISARIPSCGICVSSANRRRASSRCRRTSRARRRRASTNSTPLARTILRVSWSGVRRFSSASEIPRRLPANGPRKSGAVLPPANRRESARIACGSRSVPT